MAAMRENREVPFGDLIQFCRAGDDGDVTLIEGVGGIMVPIDERHTVLDWIDELAYPAVLVTGSYLGAISHTLTALGSLSGRGIAVRGIIVSESTEQPVPLGETANTIERHAHGIRVIALPRLTDADPPPKLAAALDLHPKKKGGADGTAPKGRTRSLPYS
jgi:dethiobiotin synthetase